MLKAQREMLASLQSGQAARQRIVEHRCGRHLHGLAEHHEARRTDRLDRPLGQADQLHPLGLGRRVRAGLVDVSCVDLDHAAQLQVVSADAVPVLVLDRGAERHPRGGPVQRVPHHPGEHDPAEGEHDGAHVAELRGQGSMMVNDLNSVKQRYAINFRGSVHDRAISLREGSILQTFDPEAPLYDPEAPISFARLGRHIGNAVPVRLGEVIADSITAHLSALS